MNQPDGLSPSLEIQFLKALLENGGQKMDTSSIAEQLGWMTMYGEADARAVASVVGQKLAKDGLIKCWQENHHWYAAMS